MVSESITRKKFTVEQYSRMMEAGILTESDRVELMSGEILELSPVERHHAACVDRLAELFFLQLTGKAIVRVQSPVRLSNISEPQPDIALLRRKTDYYASDRPRSRDIFLLLEVADTTVEYDRNVKIPAYARANISEVWLVNLNREAIFVFREPVDDNYRSIQVYEDGVLAPLAFPDARLAIAQILGKGENR